MRVSRSTDDLASLVPRNVMRMLPVPSSRWTSGARPEAIPTSRTRRSYVSFPYSKSRHRGLTPTVRVVTRSGIEPRPATRRTSVGTGHCQMREPLLGAPTGDRHGSGQSVEPSGSARHAGNGAHVPRVFFRVPADNQQAGLGSGRDDQIVPPVTGPKSVMASGRFVPAEDIADAITRCQRHSGSAKRQLLQAAIFCRMVWAPPQQGRRKP